MRTTTLEVPAPEKWGEGLVYVAQGEPVAGRHARLRVADLFRLKLPLKKLLPFVEVIDHHPGAERSSAMLKAQLVERPVQLSLF